MNFIHCVLTSPHSHRSEKTVTSDLCKPLDSTWPLQHSPARNREGFTLPLGESGSQASCQSKLICKATIFSVMLEPGERALCNVFPFSRRTFTRYFSQGLKLFLGFIISKWNSGWLHVAYGQGLLTQGFLCHPVCSCLFLLHVIFNTVGSLGGLWFLCSFV